jgi:hypothetical protein
MTKSYRKTNSNVRNRYTQKTEGNIVQSARSNKEKVSLPVSDVFVFAKRDLKWSAFTALVVAIAMAILYFVFH